jgi:hypothetical protein
MQRRIAASDGAAHWAKALPKYFCSERSNGKPIKNWLNLPQDDCCCGAITPRRVL